MGKTRFRSITRTSLAAVAAAWVALSPMSSAAGENPASPAPQQTCAGVNMLPELATNTPEAYSNIRSAAKATPNTEAILWRIEREGVPRSYLLGTVHMTDPRITGFSPKLESALAETKTLALEIADLSDNATNAAIAKAAELVIFTDGRKLDKLLSRDEYTKVKATLKSAGLPSEMAAMFRPWVISMIMSVSACERQKVTNGVPVLDLKLANFARENNKKLVGLETIESQFNAMAAIPDEQQIAMLRANLKFADRIDDTMETLLQLYLARDMGSAWPFQLALAKQAGINQDSFSGFQKRIVSDRNRQMRDTALPLLRDGSTLIAVGALHLIGNDGLVALLREAGYTMTPVE